jgi:hypothetical protein
VLPGKPGQSWRAAGILLAALSFAACGKETGPEPSEFVSLAVRGTSFEAVDSKGKTWGSKDLVGAVLNVRLGMSAARIRIDAVSPDVGGSSEVLLHKFSTSSADGKWHSLCNPTPDGRTVGFPLRGRWSANGQLEDSGPGHFEIVCAAGAQGKCVRVGYRPWERLPDGSPALRLFNACIRMFRADYSGRGVPTTEDGTVIAFFDKFGINIQPIDEPFDFEAGWDDRGAVCVHHPRIRRNVSLKQIEQSSARLRGRTGEGCNQESAETLGALIFNGSRA